MKGKRKMNGWMIALVIVGLLAGGGFYGWSKLEKEHKEARSLPLDGVDFNRLEDGQYHGYYEGGMYKWRANACDVTVAGGRVTDIKLDQNADPGSDNTDHEELYRRVIEAQSLQVDTISSATLTSKAYLKAVENALLHAHQ
jgi:uncharacterized protein with FMN-binding domain